jgi:carboxyl-terminal processing protease
MNVVQRLVGTTAAVFSLAVLLSSGVPALAQTTQAQPQQFAAAGADLDQLSRDLWKQAKSGNTADFDRIIDQLATLPGSHAVSEAAKLYQANLTKREAMRADREGEIRKELAKTLEEAKGTVRLSKALRAAIELDMLAKRKGEVAQEPTLAAIVKDAEVAAHRLETDGDILNASELFGLLNGLCEEKGTYREDVKRLGQRLGMLRLYAPRALYELRLSRMKELGEETKMPPYNSLGDDYQQKLAGIDQIMLTRAIAFADRHVERPKLNDLLMGGLDNLRVFVTTEQLKATFSQFGEPAAVAEFARALDAEEAKLREATRAFDASQVDGLIDRLRRANSKTVQMPSTVLLHEFGNGVMTPLDEYSIIIWPDEVRRFQKNTQGRFVGVGIQIEYDTQSRIKIATPLEGTPAQRAGIHSNDILSAVDGKNVYGLTLDQVVDVITGPAGTPVTLTIDRPESDAADAQMKTIDFVLERSIISVPSAKGWIRSGEREDAWEYMIDEESKIGYIRLSQFTETTGDELTQAVSSLQARGMKGLIFDLRFNPGGLLDQAVKVARKFIRVEGGIIVQAQGPSGTIENPEYTRPSQATLADLPMVVLINEGSASASEIVSGAISCYAKTGDLDAILVGGRSFGKGSVQNVWQLTMNSHMKLTVQYYMLPDKSIIHRRPGATVWGVEPNLAVEMLPKQTEQSILLRRDADVIPIDENGLIKGDLAKRVDPTDLLTKGTDLQLEAALLLIKARTLEPLNQAKADR